MVSVEKLLGTYFEVFTKRCISMKYLPGEVIIFLYEYAILCFCYIIELTE